MRNFTIMIKEAGLAATIVTAVEQGIHYWARNVGAIELVGGASEELAKKHDLPGWAFAPLSPYGFVSIDEYDETVKPDVDDDTVGTVERHKLALNKIERGLTAMAADYVLARRLGDVLTGHADAEDADVFIQCCLFGEVKYG